MENVLLSAFADEASPHFTEQLEALVRHGIPLIEIRGVDGLNILDLNDAQLSRVCALLDEYNIGVSAIGSPIGKISITEPFEPHFEKFKRAVEIAKLLGTVRIRMFSFFIPQGENPELYFDEVVRRVTKMTEYAEANGVHCCHENEKGIYGDTLPRVQKLHAAVPQLRCVFDPANYIQCGDDPAKNFAALEPIVDYMHIKDALMDGGAVVPAGAGDGALPALLEKFGKKEGVKLLTLEPHLFDFSGLQNLQDEKLEHTYRYKSADEAFTAAVEALKKLL